MAGRLEMCEDGPAWKMQGCVRESVHAIDFMYWKESTQTYAYEDVTRPRKFMYSSAIMLILYASAINIRSENSCTNQRDAIIIIYDFLPNLYSCLFSLICSHHQAKPSNLNKRGSPSTASHPIPAYTTTFVMTSTSYLMRGFSNAENMLRSCTSSSLLPLSLRDGV